MSWTYVENKLYEVYELLTVDDDERGEVHSAQALRTGSDDEQRLVETMRNCLDDKVRHPL
eukprot:425478-Heterocapsa_arctica.AAC.1